MLATKSHSEGASIAFPKTAQLLNGRPFTMDLLVRLSDRDGTLLSAGEEHKLVLLLQDRDAGKIRLTAPVRGSDGRIRTGSFTTSGILEKCGPLRRDEFQRLTLMSDGKNKYRLFLNGRECFSGSVASEGQSPAPLSGPITLGDDQKQSRMAWEIAEFRLEAGEVLPLVPQSAEAAAGQDARGWRFDFGTTESPVEPGWTQVTSATLYSRQRSWGLIAPAKGAYDFWFVPDRYWGKRSQVITTESRRARSWQFRDGIEFDSGAIFRVDVPPGRYCVAVTLGGPEKSLQVDRVEVNGQSIGESPHQKFIAFADSSSEPNSRTARGVVKIAAGEPLEISAIGAPEAKGSAALVSVMAVEILPAPTLPVVREGDMLRWTRKGGVSEFEAAASAFAKHKDGEAWTLAEKIQDPILKNTLRSWIVGRPIVTNKETLEKIHVIRDSLLDHLRGHPGDASARYLFDQTELVRNAVLAYLYQAADPRIIWGAPKGRPWKEGINQALQIQPGEPYFGHARLLAGNLLWQSGQQGGGYLDEDHWRRVDKSVAYAPPIAIFRQVTKAFPEARLARMFLGEKVLIEKEISVPPGCPAWAALEHRAMIRIVDVLHYWRRQRMDDRGLMGGGLGDDVEAFRWWNMGVFICDDADTKSGWKLLAETYWKTARQRAMPDEMQDAEHVSEDFSDTHSLLPLINLGTPDFDNALKRSRSLYDVLMGRIMQRNPQGYLMFKSHVYSAKEVDSRDGDAPYNVRTMLPLIHYAFLRPDDKQVCELITEYARSWRDMTMREIDGKPAGVTPLMILFDRSSIILPGKGSTRLKQPKDWVYPGYWSYEYPSGYTSPLYDLFVAAYALSGQDTLLDPLRKAGEFLRRFKAETPRPMTDLEVTAGAKSTGGNLVSDNKQEPRGSLGWVMKMNRSGLATAVEKYRMATGDRSFDDVLREDGSAHAQFLLGCESAASSAQIKEAVRPVETALTNVLTQLDYNEAFRTELIFNTDRIWVPGSQFINGLACGLVSGEPPFSQRGSEIQWPLFGVTWQNTGTDVSMLVDRNTCSELGVYLVGFQTPQKTIGCRFWRLKPGDYRVSLYPSAEFADNRAKPVFSKRFVVKAKGDLFEFELPGGGQYHMVVKPTEETARNGS